MSAAAIGPSSDFEKLKIRTTDAKETPDLKAVNAYLKAWKTHAHDRIATLRVKKEEREEFKKKFYEDQTALNQYFAILESIQALVSTKLSTSSDTMIRVIRRDTHIQAISCFYLNKVSLSVVSKDDKKDTTEKADALYVGAILTAPWNLPLHSEVDPDAAHLVTKGSGTVLLLSLIKHAFFHKCSYLYLRPMEGSVTFYQYLGMNLSHDKSHFYLDLRLKISDVFTKNVKYFEYKEGEAPLEKIS